MALRLAVLVASARALVQPPAPYGGPRAVPARARGAALSAAAVAAEEAAPRRRPSAGVLGPLRHVPWVGRYGAYVAELWRADEAATARGDIADVGATTLGTRVRTSLLCAVGFSLWTQTTPGAFAVGMGLQAVVAQLEYFRMAIIRGATPARKIVLVASSVMMTFAAYAPALHELVFPLAATWMMVWLLLMRRHCATIKDISTTLMGLFYVAYLPSWWVRLACAPAWTTADAAAGGGLGALAAAYLPRLRHRGAQAVFWTALTVAVSDIGAYFGGKRFGKRSLATLGLGAAAEASPNKTLEGAASGLAAAALTAAIGARCMRWPAFWASGAAYGASVSFVALVGDLTASMLKRDGEVKDFGDLFPGHGGVLDRLDGYIFVAPLALAVLPSLVHPSAWVA